MDNTETKTTLKIRHRTRTYNKTKNKNKQTETQETKHMRNADPIHKPRTNGTNRGAREGYAIPVGFFYETPTVLLI